LRCHWSSSGYSPGRPRRGSTAIPSPNKNAPHQAGSINPPARGERERALVQKLAEATALDLGSSSPGLQPSVPSCCSVTVGVGTSWHFPEVLPGAAGNGIFAPGHRRPKTCLRDETFAQRHKSCPHDREKPAENRPFRRQVLHGEFRWTVWWRTQSDANRSLHQKSLFLTETAKFPEKISASDRRKTPLRKAILSNHCISFAPK
jgi:hypothetical protein